MWVKITALHWHKFNAQAKTRYLPGMIKNLPTAVAEKAVADGHAIKMKKSRRGARPEVADGKEALSG